MLKIHLIAIAILAAGLAGAAHGEELYFPIDTLEPEIIERLPAESFSYVGVDNRLTVVVPAMTPVLQTLPVELDDGLIACINGKAMFREDGRRRFLSVADSRAYCAL